MLTRFGWATLVAAAAALAVGRTFALIELFVFGAALIAVVVISLIWVHLPIPAIDVSRRTSPGQITAGEAGRSDLVLTNLGRQRTPQLQLFERVGGRGGATFQLPPLAAGQRTGAAYLLPTADRGALRCGPLTGRRTDPLGLSARQHLLAGPVEILIHPRTVHLSPPAVGTAGDLGQFLRTAAFAQSGSEFHAMREYVPGDDIRRISWKASARSTNLMVKETVNEGLRRFTVLLDIDPASYDEPAFERAVSAAASLIGAVSASGLELRLAAADADFRGPNAASLAAHWLATVQPSSAAAPPPDSAATGDGLGVTVLVTGAASSAAAIIQRQRRGGEALVLVTTAEPSGARLTIDGTSLGAFQGGWERLVLGGDGR